MKPVGVIGGNELRTMLETQEELIVETPFGDPSDFLTRGTVHGREVITVTRQGRLSQHTPQRVNYRANLWALRYLGVRQILATDQAWVLSSTWPAGAIGLPNQLVDRTHGRRGSFFDTGAVDISFAEPYCPIGRERVLKAAATLGVPVVDEATVVVVNGPRRPTLAESQWYARQGWSLMSTTAMPEAYLAREQSLCYTSMATVTGRSTLDLLATAIADLGDQRYCACAGPNL